MGYIFETNLNKIIYKQTLLGIAQDTYNIHNRIINTIKSDILEGKKPKIKEINFKGIIQNRFLEMWDFMFLHSRNNKPKTRNFLNVFDISNFEREISDEEYFYDEKYSIYQIKKMKDYLESQIEDVDYKWFRKSDYRNGYLKQRYDEIGYNYTQEYLKDINSATENYLKAQQAYSLGTRGDIKNRERTLVKALSFQNYTKWVKKSSMEEMQNYDYGIDTQPPINAARYGLKRDTDFRPEVYNDDIFRRIDRIAQTEIANGYNTATLHQYISKGVTKFKWSTSVKETREGNCTFCISLDGLIFSYTDVPTHLKFPNTKLPFNGRDFVYPPAHPYCSCTIIPIDKENNNQDLRIIARNFLAKSLATYAYTQGINRLKQEPIAMYMNRIRQHQIDNEQDHNYFIPAVSILSLGVGAIVYLKNSNAINSYLSKIKDKVLDIGEKRLSNIVRDNLEETANNYIVDRLNEVEATKIDRQAERMATAMKYDEIAYARGNYTKAVKQYRIETDQVKSKVELASDPDLEVSIDLGKELERLEKLRLEIKETEYEMAELGLHHKASAAEKKARQVHEQLIELIE